MILHSLPYKQLKNSSGMMSTGRVMHALDTEKFCLGISNTSGVTGKSSGKNRWLPHEIVDGDCLTWRRINFSVGWSMPHESEAASSPRRLILIPALSFLEPGGR